ncbi:MAG: DUF308 domain-containing protein [Clostridia bacterium]|nr:DUF308 domain-containing protein [Clostridia bacterium]
MSMLTSIAIAVYPQMAAPTLCRVIGAIAIFTGAVKLYGYFSYDLYRLAFQYDLALGAFSVLLGMGMLFFPGRFVEAIGMAVGLFVTGDGLFSVQTAVEAKRFGLSKWWVVLMGGTIASVFAVLLVFNWSQPAILPARLSGITLALDGFQNIITALVTIRNHD